MNLAYTNDPEFLRLLKRALDRWLVHIERNREALLQRRDQLIVDIERAFAGVELGDGFSLGQTDLMERGTATAEECRLARLEDRDVDWRDIDLSRSEWKSTLGFVDPLGFRFYLPAIMCRYLRVGLSGTVDPSITKRTPLEDPISALELSNSWFSQRSFFDKASGEPRPFKVIRGRDGMTFDAYRDHVIKYFAAAQHKLKINKADRKRLAILNDSQRRVCASFMALTQETSDPFNSPPAIGLLFIWRNDIDQHWIDHVLRHTHAMYC